jgi:hypothetical protein
VVVLSHDNVLDNTNSFVMGVSPIVMDVVHYKLDGCELKVDP